MGNHKNNTIMMEISNKNKALPFMQIIFGFYFVGLTNTCHHEISTTSSN
jgi:hypothetical protein